MKFTILLPHYKTGKMTTYAVSQLLRLKGKHDVEIIIIDNSYPDDSIKLVSEKVNSTSVTVVSNPPGRMQSHGIAFDLAMPLVTTDYFITVESDSFPTKDNWLNYYEQLILNAFDSAGSILTLSGGIFMHPAGALYKKSVWQQAKAYCDAIEYTYFPNMGMKDTFPCHLMIRNDVVEKVLDNPWGYGITLHTSYLGLLTSEMLKKSEDYKPVTGPFHNGMGSNQESYFTYAQRNIQSEPSNILLNDKEKVIYRMGYEPGQWFCYYQLAMKKKLFSIPTQVEWMPDRVNQQQEFTLMENGFKHIWGVSAYHKSDHPERKDIIDRKAQIVEELYNSL